MTHLCSATVLLSSLPAKMRPCDCGQWAPLVNQISDRAVSHVKRKRLIGSPTIRISHGIIGEPSKLFSPETLFSARRLVASEQKRAK